MALYEKHNYTNKLIEYLVSREIIEYDIKEAGFNLVKKYHLLSQGKIEQLELLSKDERKISLGYMQKYDKDFADKLNEKFVEARRLFFESNDIKADDVLSIKKDAIFMLRRCHNIEFDNILFREKNIYTSYYYLNKKEIYLNKDGLDLKGIKDDKLELHKDYMLDLLFKLLRMVELSSKRQLIANLKEVSYFYKNRKLHIEYYRELNSDSLFRLKMMMPGMHEYIGVQYTNDVDEIEIEYNYMRYIVPIINLIL